MCWSFGVVRLKHYPCCRLQLATILLNHHIGRVVLGSMCVGVSVWLGWSVMDDAPTQPHRTSNTQQTKNNMTNVVIQQNSRKILMMDILMSETCWAHKKWNKTASDIKLVLYSSTITMMHGPINIRFIFNNIQTQDPTMPQISCIILHCNGECDKSSKYQSDDFMHYATYHCLDKKRVVLLTRAAAWITKWYYYGNVIFITFLWSLCDYSIVMGQCQIHTPGCTFTSLP